MNIIFWLAGTLVVVLGPIILIHELGHFIFAKLAGVRVEEFGFGFPPRLLKLWHGKGYLEIGTTRVIIPACLRSPPRLKVGTRVDAAAQQRDDGTYVLRHLTVLDSGAEYREHASETAHEDLHLRGKLTTLEAGTLYSLNLLPMGAFVKMTGEEDPSDCSSALTPLASLTDGWSRSPAWNQAPPPKRQGYNPLTSSWPSVESASRTVWSNCAASSALRQNRPSNSWFCAERRR